MDPSGVGFDLVLGVPITIGTIPLRSMFQQGGAAAPPPNYQLEDYYGKGNNEGFNIVVHLHLVCICPSIHLVMEKQRRM